MKRFVFCLFLMAICVVAHGQRTYVLSVGVSRYQNESNNLAQTTKDAKNVAQLFKNHTVDVSILTSRNATRENILAMLRKICTTATKNDKIIFYFSGHGYDGGICAHDKFVSYKEILSIYNNCSAKMILTLVDACFSGSVSMQNGNYQLKSNMIFMMSSRPNEVSTESSTIEAGFFTNSLLKGLRGKADKNRDYAITIYELFTYIHKDVQEHNKKQHPRLIAPRNTYNMHVVKWKKQ